MILRHLRWAAGCALVALGLLLPYRLRIVYGDLLAWFVHAPYVLFGRVARILVDRLGMKVPG